MNPKQKLSEAAKKVAKPTAPSAAKKTSLPTKIDKAAALKKLKG